MGHIAALCLQVLFTTHNAPMCQQKVLHVEAITQQFKLRKELLRLSVEAVEKELERTKRSATHNRPYTQVR